MSYFSDSAITLDHKDSFYARGCTFSNMDVPFIVGNYLSRSGFEGKGANQVCQEIEGCHFTKNSSHCLVFRGWKEETPMKNLMSIKRCSFEMFGEAAILLDHSPVEWFEILNSNFSKNNSDFCIKAHSSKSLKVSCCNFTSQRGGAILM